MKKNLVVLSIAALSSAAPSWAGPSCNALLNLGFYNVSQKSAGDAQALGKSTFCAYDYKRADLSVKQKAGIEAAYGLFSGGAVAGNATDIIALQSSVCAAGFGVVTYGNQASAYSKGVYQGALDAWNKCQALSLKGLLFEVDPSSTLQGVTVNITAPQGLPALYSGVNQYGAGRSNCTTTNNGKLVTVGPSRPFKFTSTSNVTVNCERQLVAAGDDLTADAQDLVFTTNVGNLNVPLAAIGSLSRVTADQINANTEVVVNTAIGTVGDTIINSVKNPWIQCGVIGDLPLDSCHIEPYTLDKYEYGIAYNSDEPHPVVCTHWNLGRRIANKLPYFVLSDIPTNGMGYGGFVFYRGTQASDDNCPNSGWRQRYWQFDANGRVNIKDTATSLGCYSSEVTLFCRRR